MPTALRLDLITVWDGSRPPDPRAGGRLDHIVTDEDAVVALEDVERFVLAVMHVERGHGPSRTRHVDGTEHTTGVVR
jgi:hypothetical protein